MSNDAPKHQIETIATALYQHRYPRAMQGVTVAHRDHPSLGRIWREAEAVARALRVAQPESGEIPRPSEEYRAFWDDGQFYVTKDGSKNYKALNQTDAVWLAEQLNAAARLGGAPPSEKWKAEPWAPVESGRAAAPQSEEDRT